MSAFHFEQQKADFNLGFKDGQDAYHNNQLSVPKGEGFTNDYHNGFDAGWWNAADKEKSQN